MKLADFMSFNLSLKVGEVQNLKDGLISAVEMVWMPLLLQTLSFRIVLDYRQVLNRFSWLIMLDL